MKKNNGEVTICTLIGRGTELQGDFTAKGSVRIDGKVNGNVTVEGSLILGAGALIDGEVSAEAVLIGGEVIGNINAPKKAELTTTAKVIGDITTGAIVIDEHAVFQGKCDMNQAAPDRKNRSSAAKAVRAGKKSAKAVIAEALKEVKEEEQREAQKAADEAAVKTESTGITES